jgi:hypothetical protein
MLFLIGFFPAIINKRGVPNRRKWLLRCNNPKNGTVCVKSDYREPHTPSATKFWKSTPNIGFVPWRVQSKEGAESIVNEKQPIPQSQALGCVNQIYRHVSWWLGEPLLLPPIAPYPSWPQFKNYNAVEMTALKYRSRNLRWFPCFYQLQRRCHRKSRRYRLRWGITFILRTIYIFNKAKDYTPVG